MSLSHKEKNSNSPVGKSDTLDWVIKVNTTSEGRWTTGVSRGAPRRTKCH